MQHLFRKNLQLILLVSIVFGSNPRAFAGDKECKTMLGTSVISAVANGFSGLAKWATEKREKMALDRERNAKKMELQYQISQLEEELQLAETMVISVQNKSPLSTTDFLPLVEQVSKTLEESGYPSQVPDMASLLTIQAVGDILKNYGPSLNGEQFNLLLRTSIGEEGKRIDYCRQIIINFQEFAKWVELSPQDLRNLVTTVREYVKRANPTDTVRINSIATINHFTTEYLGTPEKAKAHAEKLSQQIKMLSEQLQSL